MEIYHAQMLVEDVKLEIYLEWSYCALSNSLTYSEFLITICVSKHLDLITLCYCILYSSHTSYFQENFV